MLVALLLLAGGLFSFVLVHAATTSSGSITIGATVQTLPNQGSTPPPPPPKTDNPPTITNITVTSSLINVQTAQARISWQTSDDHGITKITFVYGLTPDYGLSASPAGNEVNIFDLKPNTTYYFKITVTDTGGNNVESFGAFKTLSETPLPTIFNIKVDFGVTTATITWQTSIPTDSQVQYGLTTAYGTTMFNAALAPSHSVTLNGLAPATTYHFRVVATDSSGNSAPSPNQTFTTKPSTVPTPEVCTNNVDDDNNGATDCADIACGNHASCRIPRAEICTNNIDDDGNGATDCGDVACVNAANCRVEPLPTPENCSNQIDDNQNGLVDCADAACAQFAACVQLSPTPETTTTPPVVSSPTPAIPTPILTPTTTTIPLISNLEELSERAQQSIQKAVRRLQEFKNSPEVQEKASQQVVPTVVSIAAISTIALVSWADLLALLRFLFLQPLLLLGRRQRAGWGQVYNALNKQPVDLATLRLIDIALNKVVQTKVTDKQGRYAFMVNPGEYRIEASKNGLAFPSELLKAYHDDGRRTDIYHGETIKVSEEEAVITANIPLDPLGEYSKPVRLYWQQFGRRLQLILSWVGIIITAVSLYIAPRWYVAVLLGIHLFLFFIFRRLAIPSKVKSWGIVYDAASKSPVGRTVARLFNSQFNKLVSTQITDKRGRYYFLAGDDTYYVTYEHPKYDTHKTEAIDLTGKESDNITVDVGLQNKSASGVPSLLPPNDSSMNEKENDV